MEYRIEKDTIGEVQVPAEVYWGAQTQRSIQNFDIARDINKMPKEIIKRKIIFWSHIFLNFFGQSRPRPVNL